MRRDDELDPLRRAWSELDAPDPERALEEPDEATRAALDWMRGAWSRLEPPLASAIPQLKPAPVRRRPRWIPLAAAAGIGGLLLWAALGGERDVRERPDADTPLAQVERAPEPEPEPEPERPELPVPEPEPFELAAVSPDRMELRSGPVRLILLTRNTDLVEVRPEDG